MCRKAISLVGRKFGLLTPKEIVSRNGFRNSRWLCQCDCGGSKEVLYQNLVSNNVKSCGCLKRGRPFKERALGKPPSFSQN